MDLDLIWQEVSKNQFFSGGFILMILGAAGLWVRALPRIIWKWFCDRVSVTMHVTARDPIFAWMLRWIAGHGYAKNWARNLTPWTDKKRGFDNDLDDDHDSPVVMFTASPGTHYLLWRRRLVVVTRSSPDRGEKMAQQYASQYGPFASDEVMTITVYARNREIAKELIRAAARDAHEAQTKGKVPVVEVQSYQTLHSDWCSDNEQRCRPLESVILKQGVMEGLVDDISTFLGRPAWYAARGIPYRRGYLFYGDPGSGKSSTVLALASHFKLTICVLDLTAKGIDDQHLRKAFASLPAKAAILIEDVDCLFEQRKLVDDKAEITFSGFLNSIDGVTGSEGRLLFLTTNYKNRLDPALIRPGRCDMSIEFTEPDLDQMERMWVRFFPEKKAYAASFADNIPAGASMASIQGHLIRYSHCWHDALAAAPDVSLADVTDHKTREALIEQECLT